MSWKDQLQTASFRGASFGVTESNLEGGRRNAVHEFPNRESAYVEDLGGKNRTYAIEGFVVGSDYMTARDSLQTALETGGSGLLVHPYYGSLTVAVDSYAIRESAEGGGMASFSMTFVKSLGVSYPSSSSASASASSTITAAADNSASAMESLFDVSDGGDIQTLSQTQVTESVGIIQTQTKLKVKSSSVDVENIEGKINAFDNFMRDSARVLTDLSTLIAEPQTLCYKLIDLVSRMIDMVNTPLHAVAGYLRMYSALSDYFSGLSFLSSAKGDTEKQNAQILRDVLLLPVLSYAATAAADADYETRTQATENRDSITDMIDSFLADVLDDSMFESALDLRNSVVKSVPSEGTRLPDLVSVDVPATVSSLVLAHEIYGDIDEEADLISRNSVRNPWAIQGGASVEVLQ